MSAFGGTLDVHTPLAFVAVHASGVTFRGSRALWLCVGKDEGHRTFLCWPISADGLEAGNHHSKVSSSCEIILKLKLKCRYSRRVRGGAEKARVGNIRERVTLCNWAAS
jgi:hypothetical protein